MSTYTVNIIHKKWYSLQSFMHINRKQKSPTSSSSSASSTLSNVIHIPPFQSDTKVIQSQQLQASRCKLPSGKLPRRRNLTNSSHCQKNSKAIPATNDVKNYLQLLYTRFSYSIAAQSYSFFRVQQCCNLQCLSLRHNDGHCNKGKAIYEQ